MIDDSWTEDRREKKYKETMRKTRGVTSDTHLATSAIPEVRIESDSKSFHKSAVPGRANLPLKRYVHY